MKKIFIIITRCLRWFRRAEIYVRRGHERQYKLKITSYDRVREGRNDQLGRIFLRFIKMWERLTWASFGSLTFFSTNNFAQKNNKYSFFQFHSPMCFAHPLTPIVNDFEREWKFRKYHIFTSQLCCFVCLMCALSTWNATPHLISTSLSDF